MLPALQFGPVFPKYDAMTDTWRDTGMTARRDILGRKPIFRRDESRNEPIPEQTEDWKGIRLIKVAKEARDDNVILKSFRKYG